MSDAHLTIVIVLGVTSIPIQFFLMMQYFIYVLMLKQKASGMLLKTFLQAKQINFQHYILQIKLTIIIINFEWVIGHFAGTFHDAT